MAEKLGEGRRNDDGRRTGAHDRYKRTVHGGDMVGDKRKLPKKASAPTPGGGRSVPIAETLGGDLARRQNGGGSRVAPSGMLKAGGV